jgi:hypothetical protein
MAQEGKGARRSTSRGHRLPLALIAPGLALVLVHTVLALAVDDRVAPLLAPAGETLEASEPLRFAVLSDNSTNMDVFAELLAKVKAERPAFVLHCGDTVPHPEPRYYDWTVRTIREAGLDCPICVVPGNHDGNKRVVDPAVRTRLFRRAFGPRRYWFACGDAAFVGFDNGSERAPQGEQNWLDHTLARLRPRYRTLIVFLHVPPRDPRNTGPRPEDFGGESYNHAMVSDGPAVEAILKRHRVDAVFTGHIHGYLEHRIGDIPVYTSGGAGSKLVMKGVGYHFLLCTLADGELRVRKIELDREPTPPGLAIPPSMTATENVTLVAGAALVGVGALVLALNASRPPR